MIQKSMNRVTCFSLFLISLLSACKPSAVSEPAQTDSKRIRIESRRLTSSATAFSTVESASSSLIRAQIGGRIGSIRAERGKHIVPGDILLEVISERCQRQRDEQQSKVKSCEWALKKKELERDSKQGADREIAAADVEIARVDLEIAKRKLDTAIDDLNNCTVRAAFPGRIISVDIKEGDLVTGTGDFSLGSVLFQVVGSNDYIAEVSLGEVETARIDANCRVEVRLPAVFGEVFDAKIKSISQAGRRSDRGVVFPVVIAFSSENPHVKLGLSAEVRFLFSSTEAVIAVPLSVVHFDEKGPWIGVEVSGKREQRYVKLGVNDSTFVEIVSGIKGDDLLME